MQGNTASSAPSIRIFVSSHKRATYPPSGMLIPMQVGAGQAAERFPDMLHDDEGDNISAKNPMYCELTTQYWAWKNDAEGPNPADYYGFCHYRRYFDFSNTPHRENDYGEIIDERIDEKTMAEYGLDDGSIALAVNGWDVITTPLNDVRRIGGFGSLKEHYDADRNLRLADLRHVYDILCARHPEYREDADRVLNGRTAAFCNMFIMRRDIFIAYCEWLFPLLDEFTATTDMTHGNVQTLRTPGHLAERLLNIYLAHQERVGAGWRIKRLQCVHFLHPERREELASLETAGSNGSNGSAGSDVASAAGSSPIIPVVFAADDNYVPMLTTTIHSMLSNASPDYRYDVIVLERDITPANKRTMIEFLSRYRNATIRFYDVSPIIDGYRLTTSNAHISIETYYRFVIQDALPFYDTILYLDSDLVVNGDVAELYRSTTLGSNLIGAVHDLDFLGNLGVKNGKRMSYAKMKLHMRDPYQYFQAGVLVMNLAGMRRLHSVAEWLRIAADPEYIYNDQDILNQECEGHVTYLDYSWNVMHDCAGRVDGVFALAPATAFKAYQQSRKAPRIVHYAGFDKPWKNPWCDFAPLYWHYAKETPFALQLIASMAGVERPTPPQYHERAIAENSPLRRYVDVLAPSGSMQREMLKTIARKAQGKK